MGNNCRSNGKVWKGIIPVVNFFFSLSPAFVVGGGWHTQKVEVDQN